MFLFLLFAGDYKRRSDYSHIAENITPLHLEFLFNSENAIFELLLHGSLTSRPVLLKPEMTLKTG